MSENIATVSRTGSIGGASFNIESGTTTVGGKLIINEHVLSSTPTIENFGNQAVKISINVYTTGPGWLGARDAIISACQSGGPTSLVNPFYPSIALVQVASCAASNTKDELGKCNIAIECVQTHPWVSGPGFGVSPHFSSALEFAIDAAVIVSTDVFLSAINTSGGDRVTSATSTVWQDGWIEMDGARLLSDVDTDDMPYYEHNIADLYANADSISRGSSLTKEATLLEKIETFVGFTRESMADVDIARNMPIYFNSDFEVPVSLADTVVAAGKNEFEVSRLIRHLSGMLAGEAAAKVDYGTRKEALEALNKYNIWWEYEAAKLNTFTDDESYLSFDRVRSATLDLFQDNITNTVPVREITLPGLQSSLHIAMNLYGDPGRAFEIWSGSGADHPSFLGPNLTVKAA